MRASCIYPRAKEGPLKFDWLFIVGGSVRVLLSLLLPQIGCSLPYTTPLLTDINIFHTNTPRLSFPLKPSFITLIATQENVFRAQYNEQFYLKQITCSNTWTKRIARQKNVGQKGSIFRKLSLHCKRPYKSLQNSEILWKDYVCQIQIYILMKVLPWLIFLCEDAYLFCQQKSKSVFEFLTIQLDVTTF